MTTTQISPQTPRPEPPAPGTADKKAARAVLAQRDEEARSQARMAAASQAPARTTPRPPLDIEGPVLHTRPRIETHGAAGNGAAAAASSMAPGSDEPEAGSPSTFNAPGADAARAQARVRMVGAWFDPFDPTIWSGIPSNLAAELEKLGTFDGYSDVTPYPALSAQIHSRLSRTKRRNSIFPLTPELRVLASVANVGNRRKLSPAADAWVVPASAFGRPVHGRTVTLCEIAPRQLADMGPESASAFGLSGLSAAGLSSVVRQQTRIHRHAHACCVASHWARDSLVNDTGVDPDKVHVVGYGRNIDVPAPPGRDWETPRFLFVGNDWQRKNGDAVVRAFVRVRELVPEAQLDVVGGHPAIDVPGVTAHGRLGFEDAAQRRQLELLFATATCFVMPSTLEPFGIVYVEAAAAGLPSIGGNAGGTATSIGDGGLTVDPDDEESIVEAMTRLADPVTAMVLGRRARRRSAEFTWTKMAERVLRATGLDVANRDALAGYL